MLLKELLFQKWEEVGLIPGDILLLHSDIKRLYRYLLRKGFKNISVDEILSSLIEFLTPNGTLVIPTFNFEFPDKKFFDINNTCSEMGVISEHARNLFASSRTFHPVYSFVSYGKYSTDFAKINNVSAYGDDSPFALLLDLNAKISVLGLDDQQSMTFYHHVEEMENVDYRYHKSFSGKYIDKNNEQSFRQYSIFVRNTDIGVVTDVNPAGELLWCKGIYQGYRFNEDIGLRWCHSTKFYDFVSKLIKQNIALGHLYSLEK